MGVVPFNDLERIRLFRLESDQRFSRITEVGYIPIDVAETRLFAPFGLADAFGIRRGQYFQVGNDFLLSGMLDGTTQPVSLASLESSCKISSRDRIQPLADGSIFIIPGDNKIYLFGPTPANPQEEVLPDYIAPGTAASSRCRLTTTTLNDALVVSNYRRTAIRIGEGRWRELTGEAT